MARTALKKTDYAGLSHIGTYLDEDLPRINTNMEIIDAQLAQAARERAELGQAANTADEALGRAVDARLKAEAETRAEADSAIREALSAETAARKAPATVTTLGGGFAATAAEVQSGIKDASRGDAPAFVDVAHVNAIRDKHIYINGAWRSQDGLAWYRKWSDGFIEQGGFVGHNTSNYTWVNLYTPFTSINYTVIATLGLMSGPYPAVSGLTAFSDSHATTGFSLFTRTQDNQLLTFSTFWRASGF